MKTEEREEREKFYCKYDRLPAIWLEDTREYCCNVCGTLIRDELLNEGELLRAVHKLGERGE